MRVLLVLALATALLSGCAPAKDDDFIVPIVPPSKVDVDTPALRSAKAAAGIADCTPGTGDNDLPEVTLPCFGGGPDVRLDTLTGPLVVSFWAGWCGPCRKELPYYARLSRDYADKLGVIGIDYLDQQTEAAMDLLGDTGVTYPQLADPGGDLAGKAGLPPLRNLPVVVLVGADGSIAGFNIGEITSYSELRQLVSDELGIAA
ncbi:TlpA family protein disulfide reductase [Nocardioides sp.]|uniref:TlpA family protein disulfide reductase n=1 Tax=Nocardioides sp. TaxID=35761 RepID=UPI003D0DC6B8